MSISESKLDKGIHILITLFMILGLGMTIVSWMQICSEACVDVHQYKYFGFDFEFLGFVFFAIAIPLHIISRTIGWLSYLVSLMVAGAVGSEINFILVQYFVIGQWCPICMTIAALIGVIALLVIYRFLFRFIVLDQPITWGKSMKALGKIVGGGAVVAISYVIALVGVFKPETSFADGVGGNKPYFGNENSSVEVYYISDWFCPACVETEPELAPYFPRIMAKSRLYFIDYPIHPETMNYVPYNLSFMINDKQQYFKVRKAMKRLAKKTKTPTSQQVEEAVKAYGVTYQPMNFSDINDGIKFQEGIVKTFKVNQTPTVVVANREKLKAKKLTGANLTPERIMKAIDDMKH